MNRRTKKYCNIDFFEYDEDIDLNETTAEVLHIFSEAAVSVIDSEPIMDHETYYKGEWESDRELYRMYGEALPRHIVQWSHWDNLNTLKDFAFAGILQCKQLILITTAIKLDSTAFMHAYIHTYIHGKKLDFLHRCIVHTLYYVHSFLIQKFICFVFSLTMYVYVCVYQVT